MAPFLSISETLYATVWVLRLQYRHCRDGYTAPDAPEAFPYLATSLLYFLNPKC